MDPILQIRDLYKSFNNIKDKENIHNIVLNGINLSVDAEDTVIILGKSGVGKTVLLKLIIGLERPDKGKILIFGEDITELNEIQLNRIRRHIAMIFQESALFDYLTVRENIRFYLDEHTRLTRQEKERLVIENLLKVKLSEDILNLYPHALSFGMRKRVALARALIYNPKIILFDEPTAGLDPIISKDIARLIKEVKERFNLTILVVTHDIELAKYLSSGRPDKKNKVLLLHQGRLISNHEMVFKD